MKILYCIPQLYNAGGMERVLCQKVNWLARHTNHQLAILTTELVPNGKAISHFDLDESVTIYQLNLDFDSDFAVNIVKKWWNHQRKIRLYKRQLSALIQEKQIDLCISLCGKEIAFLSTLPCPTIAEVHFSKNHRRMLIDAYHSGWVWKMLGNIRTQALINDVKKLKHFVCLTEQDKQEWQDAGCTNVICIPNPCSLDATPLNESTLFCERPATAIGVGRLHPQKGFDRLILAWAIVATKHPDWHLNIIGEGEERSALEAQIAALGLQDQVSLPGRCDSMIKVYSEAAMLVLSSRYEGLPLAMIEAMWCATPCVAYNCPQGPSELLSDERGLLVEEGDIEGLADAILTMIENKEKRTAFAQKAYHYAHTRFSEETIMQQWIKLIEACK